MALTRTETQITWAGASSITIAGAGYNSSDAYLFDATDVAASIQVSAKNATPAASGDVMNVYIKFTTGDVLADTGDDYDSDEHAQFLMLLNTFNTDNPGEDPAIKTVDIPVSAKGFKLATLRGASATHNMVVKARITTQRAA